MERSSRVLHHGNAKKKKIPQFFLLKFNFDLLKAEIILVGFNMKLCDDIGDASSSSLLMDLSRHALRTNGKLFSNFGNIF